MFKGGHPRNEFEIIGKKERIKLKSGRSVNKRSVNKLSERINKIDYQGISGTATTPITGKHKDYLDNPLVKYY